MTALSQKKWFELARNHYSCVENIEHVYRVARYSLKIAEKLNLFQDDLEVLFQASLIHELKYINMFSHALDIELAVYIVKHKDEWYDGTGKPSGLSEGLIPLLSRVLSIADFYDELIFKHKLSKKDAIAKLYMLNQTRFDPILIPIAIRELEEMI